MVPWLALVFALASAAAGEASISTGGSSAPASSTTAPASHIINLGGDELPNVQNLSYLSVTSTMTASELVNGTVPGGINITTSGDGHNLVLATATPTSTTSIAPPAATQACNLYVEFCQRSYANITNVCAHNSPFNTPHDLFSDQEESVFAQLNDGIRMLQGQTHLQNGEQHYCHTSCELADAGPAEAFYASVAAWLAVHPYEVVTILIGNGDYAPVTDYIAPIQQSGLSKYVFIPPVVPMSLSDWPTLAELIVANQRAIIFMDYKADQSAVPYILDEFSQLWETPFSPTDRNFPCTVDRPPGLKANDAEKRLFMINHNLNTDINFAGVEILVPNEDALNATNGVSGYESVGLAAQNCIGEFFES